MLESGFVMANVGLRFFLWQMLGSGNVQANVGVRLC